MGWIEMNTADISVSDFMDNLHINHIKFTIGKCGDSVVITLDDGSEWIF